MLSTGNLCRQHVANATEFGLLLDGYLKKGQLIPDDLMTDMVIDWLVTQQHEQSPVILDGFPRTQGQARRFLEFLNKHPQYHFRVIVIELPEEDIVMRLSRRLLCSNKQCQAPFTQAPGLTNCTYCGSPLYKRDDDREEVVRERLRAYPAYRDMLMLFYEQMKQPTEILNIQGLDSEHVYQNFCRLAGIDGAE